jgi:hypothetical protein
VQYFYRGITSNQAGFRSDRDYRPHKQRPYRIIIYGDSFTAMMYENRPWPDHLHRLLELEGIEVYNFSFEAGGLANWHAHYFKQLVPTYEFDMVVFALCCDDMTRPFSMWETRADGAYFNRFVAPPSDEAEFNNYRGKLIRLAEMASPDRLREINEHFTAASPSFWLPLDLYLSQAIATRVRARVTTPQTSAIPLLPVDSQREMFRTMLRDVRRRGKTAVVVILPWAGADPILPRDLANEGCAAFLDGTALVEFKAADAFPRPTYDGHWLAPAANYFAERLAPRLLSLRDTHRRTPCSIEDTP